MIAPSKTKFEVMVLLTPISNLVISGSSKPLVAKTLESLGKTKIKMNILTGFLEEGY